MIMNLSRTLFRPLGFLAVAAALDALLTSTACSGREEQPGPAAAPPPAAPAAGADEPALEPLPFESELPNGVRSLIDKPFTGDFDATRRMIRVGVTFNRTHYFVDRGTPRGLAYDYLKVFEDELNKKLKTGNLKIHVVFIPLQRDLLLPALVNGRVDLVAAQLTVTPERQKVVDFSNPTRENISEVVVAGPGVPAVKSVDDLSGREVFVRKTSSYFESLQKLNEQLAGQGKPPVSIKPAPENLEDDDLLEMTNAGLIPITVVDNYVAEFWKTVFTDLTVYDTAALRTGAHLAVAIRKNSPKLAAEINAFIARYGLESALANTLNRKYLQSTKYVRNATSDA
jgi:membrane-bound lytic murein transglycosylase MltF